jgi:hypothetical protein
MPRRTIRDPLEIEDLLREEYFELLPIIRRLAAQLETDIRSLTLPVLHELQPYEQLIVKSRVKECESALNTLLGPKEGRIFDPDRAGGYSLSQLPDLAGVRVLVFPNSRLIQVDDELRGKFSNWTPKPVTYGTNSIEAPKYFGYYKEISREIRAEYQVVPMLLGLFWEVEHAAMYKFRAAARSKDMRNHRTAVEDSLINFDNGMESFLRDNIVVNPDIPSKDWKEKTWQSP